MPPVPHRLPVLVAALCAALLTAPAISAVPGGGYPESLTASGPSDDTSDPTTGTCTGPAPALGWERAEERLPGTRAWRIGLTTSASPTPPVVGFLDRTTVHCGESVGVHLAGHARVRLSAYRVGWYGGSGARLVWTSQLRFSHEQPPATISPGTRMVETAWPTTTTLHVTRDWTPGIYLVEVQPADAHGPAGPGAVMPLVVESATQAPLLAVASTLTWAAYNEYGGSSMYLGPTGYADRSLVSSLDRPLTGMGLNHLLLYDLPIARFLGRLGLDVDWTTDDGLDERPSQLKGPAAVVFPGHSEYWTSRMYDAVESARDNGLNIAFLGADPVYWQARLAPSPLGTRRHLVVYRDAIADPVSVQSVDQTTVRWRDAPLQRDEAQLAGVTYSRSGVNAGMQVADAPAWMLAGTGLQKGSPLPDIGSNEVDSTAQYASDAPPNLQLVLQGAFSDDTGAVSSFAASYYTTPGGAGVFSAGTTAWPTDLEGANPWQRMPASAGEALRILTANVLRAFTTPGFTASNPSTASARRSPQQVWDEMPAGLRGKAGPRTVGGLNDD